MQLSLLYGVINITEVKSIFFFPEQKSAASTMRQIPGVVLSLGLALVYLLDIGRTYPNLFNANGISHIPILSQTKTLSKE